MKRSVFILLYIIFLCLYSQQSFAQEGSNNGDEQEEVKVPKMKQAKNVAKSDKDDALYSSAKTKKKNNKKTERKNIRKNEKNKKKDYRKLRKKQQNMKTTGRMRRNQRKSSKINEEKEAPLFKRIFSTNSTKKKHKKKEHKGKRKKKQKKVKKSSGFSRFN